MRVNWQHRFRRFRIIHLLAIFLLFTVALKIKNTAVIVACQGQGQPSVKLSVDDPRLVAEAVKQLQEKYGWIITYEDPRQIIGQQAQAKLDQQIDIFDSEAESGEEQLIELAQRFQIPIGIEWSDTRAKKSAPSVHLRKTTVREAIRQILQQHPNHEFEVRDGIVYIFSPSLLSDGRNFLNLRIQEFSLSNANLIDASHKLRLAISLSQSPGLNYGGGYGYGTPRDDGFDKNNISFSGQNLTVREILTKIAVANGNALWIVRLIPSQMMTNYSFFVQGPLSDEYRNATSFIWQFIPLGKVPSQSKSR